MSLPPLLQGRLSLPVIGAPMFIVSGPDLVIAQCRAGVVGAFPALNARPAAQLGEWLARITAELALQDAAPYAVNLIAHRSNTRIGQDLETCVKFRVPIIISSLGVRPEVIDAVHGYGGLVLQDIVTPTQARKAIEKGADGLVAVAAGAGGHAGDLSPFALVQEIRTWFDGLLALSGAIAHGGAVLAALAAGADLAYVGSAFIATDEAAASDAYKQAIVAGSAEGIVRTSHFTGIPGNYLRASIVAAGLDPDQLPGDPAKLLLDGGAKAWRDIWGAGHGIGAVGSVVPVADRVNAWRQEYAHALRHAALAGWARDGGKAA